MLQKVLLVSGRLAGSIFRLRKALLLSGRRFASPPLAEGPASASGQGYSFFMGTLSLGFKRSGTNALQDKA